MRRIPTASLEVLREKRVRQVQPQRRGLGEGLVDSRVDDMAPTHEGGARRAADWLNVVVHEGDAVGRDRVDVGCADLLRAVEAHIIKPQILRD